jgi:hypothetical protein
MSDGITCICGYRGPSVPEGGRPVCPICRTPAETGRQRPAAPPPVAMAPAATPAAAAAPRPSGPKYYRIPCPNGHNLKVGPAMIGQQAVCPTCNTVFEIRLEDSREYLLEQESLRQQKEAEDAEKWLKRAIWSAVFIGASLIGMTVLYAVFRQAGRRPSPPPPEPEITAPAEETTVETTEEAPAEPVAE